MNGWQIFVEVPGHPPVEIRSGESIIGRSRASQVHIPESTVSRQHARLIAGGLGEMHVEDLGSSNGTYVNGEKVEGRRKLVDGDRILVGDAEVRVRIVAPVASSEATVRMVLPPLGAPPPAAPPKVIDPPLHTDLPAAPPVPPPTAPPPVAPPPVAPPQPPVAPAPAPRAAPSRPAAAPVVPPPTAPPPVPAAPPAAPPATPVRPAAPRRDVLPSVTAIDRIPIPEPSQETVEAARLARARPAGFWVRLVAGLVDAALLGVVAVAVGALGFFAPVPETEKLTLVYALVTGLGLAYPTIFWAVRGATPGKQLLGIGVVVTGSTPGRGIGFGPAILRALGYVASSLLFGIGFLLIAFTSQKQGLHDLIAGSRVLRLR